jgi:hypothetical protein
MNSFKLVTKESAAVKFLGRLSYRTKVTISSALTIVVGLYVLWHLQMPAAIMARLAPPLWPF